jgi:hypothetical protein
MSKDIRIAIIYDHKKDVVIQDDEVVVVMVAQEKAIMLQTSRR